MGIGNALKTKLDCEKIDKKATVLLDNLSQSDPQPLPNFTVVVIVDHKRPILASQMIGGVLKSELKMKLEDPSFDEE